jgi:ubiquinone biosynthesis protein COQ9
VTLVPTLGFTRTAISQAAANVCSNQELPNRSIDHIFGRGDDARKTLIRAWLDKGREAMAVPNAAGVNVKDSLQRRLEWNTPVLDKLPEVVNPSGFMICLSSQLQAFALLATPSGAFPSIDARAILEHPALVAHTACRLAQHDPSGVRQSGDCHIRHTDDCPDDMVRSKSSSGLNLCSCRYACSPQMWCSADL